MRHSYEKTWTGRRVVIAAAAGAGLIGLNRMLIAADGAPVGGPGETARAAAAPAAHTSGYRLRSFAAGAGARPDNPLRRPVRAREAAASTLSGFGQRVALTFDDGPHPEYTGEVLRVLRQHQAPATFFVIGENAERHPDLVRAIAADGHLIANHSWSHPQLTRLRPGEVRRELGATSELLTAILGETPGWARAPYGAWDRPALRICAELGMEPLGWSVDTEDWTEPGAAAIAATVLDQAHPGAVVLAHDGGGNRAQTVSALAYYLPRLIDSGYQPVRAM